MKCNIQKSSFIVIQLPLLGIIVAVRLCSFLFSEKYIPGLRAICVIVDYRFISLLLSIQY